MRRTSTLLAARPGAVAALSLAMVFLACGAEGRNPVVQWANHQAKIACDRAIAWYQTTPADERVTWAGLACCAVFGGAVTLERLARVRRKRVIPRAYGDKFHSRLVEGKLDRGKALDYCELNPSPVANVVLAAIRRWGRPAGDLERGVALARSREVDHLRRNIATLRRIAILAPLIGLLGSLHLVGRVMSTEGEAWGPAMGAALGPLTAGVALAIIALVAYDGLTARVERIASALDRLGAETVDAIAMSVPSEPSRAVKIRREPGGPSSPTPHAVRVEVPYEAE